MNSFAERMKWLGTGLLLIGVTLNILNNPDLQQYVYPWNLVINTMGCGSLLVSAILQQDKPYVVLNGILGVSYFLGATNAFFPFSEVLSCFIENWETNTASIRAFIHTNTAPL